MRMTILPNKTDPPLVVDSNTVLTLPVRAKSLKPVARWNLEVLQRRGSIHLHQFPERNTLYLVRNCLASFAAKELAGLLVPEALDHNEDINAVRYYGQRPASALPHPPSRTAQAPLREPEPGGQLGHGSAKAPAATSLRERA
jgi:hypothetical protein